MERNLAILEGNFDWVPGKKHIFSSRAHKVNFHSTSKVNTRLISSFGPKLNIKFTVLKCRNYRNQYVLKCNGCLDEICPILDDFQC